MKILITGAGGHLGGWVARQASASGHTVVGTRLSGPAGLDIRDAAAVKALFSEVRLDAVIHTAAGRSDWRVMADGAAHVALACAATEARLVHVSTDAIFDGREITYDESAQPSPLYLYGAAKAAAETAVRAVCPSAAVVRTSVIVGGGDGQHETLTRDLIAGRASGALFTDLIRMPVHAGDLASALVELAASPFAGVLNVAGPEAISRYDLGKLVARGQGLDPARLPAAELAGSGLALAADVQLVSTLATEVLATRLRGVHEFLG